MEIVPVALLTDNYAYLVHQGDTTVVIDPSVAPPVSQTLRARGWRLNAVLNTHHHWDHVGGNPGLKKEFGCEVTAARGDRARVAGCDSEMAGGQKLVIGSLSFDVLFIPGHTLHHVALWSPEAKAVFTGDTLFLGGCGRIFEGTPAQMWASLQLLAELPGDTQVYCGHEYTQDNLVFALAQTPDDRAVQARMSEVAALRSAGKTTVPGNLAQEKATNPFLRVLDDGYRERVCPGGSALEAFTQLRKRKDGFK